MQKLILPEERFTYCSKPNRKTKNYMKTKAITLVVASLSCVVALAAPAPTAPPVADPATNVAAAARPAEELEPPLLEKPATAAAPEIMPLISFDAEYPTMEAVTNLAQQAGITY